MSHIIEKEIKILDIDVEKVEHALISFGAAKTFVGDIHDIYYDTPEKTLEEEGKRLRMRKQGTQYIITMKQKLSSHSIRKNEEWEQEVSHIAAAESLIKSYNCIPFREKRKKRISYTLDKVHFDIDMYRGIPALLEIEASSKKEIFLWIHRLGLEKKTTASYGSRSLFKFYNKPYLFIS